MFVCEQSLFWPALAAWRLRRSHLQCLAIFPPSRNWIGGILIRVFLCLLLVEDRPLILQGDLTLILETAHPRFVEMRDWLLPFAELVKSPEHLHTYRITPISIWNAAAAGLSSSEVLDFLERESRYPVPDNGPP